MPVMKRFAALVAGVSLSACGAGDPPTSEDAIPIATTTSQAVLPDGLDPLEFWHGCDEAATDAEFAKAGPLRGDLSATTTTMVDGEEQGKDLIALKGETSTGPVECVIDRASGDVVFYRFDGQTVIRR